MNPWKENLGIKLHKEMKKKVIEVFSADRGRASFGEKTAGNGDNCRPRSCRLIFLKAAALKLCKTPGHIDFIPLSACRPCKFSAA